ncbi:MAG: hypothetical protein ACP5E5_01280 [Acidobacteriaceae bacterium]
MSRKLCRKTLPALLAGVAMVAPVIFAQGIPNEALLPTTATITVDTKADVPLDPRKLRLQVGRDVVPITSVTPINPPATQLAILIDDGLRGSFDNQLSDLAEFINELPPGVQVLLGYMRNGIVLGMHHFTTDHQAVVATMRIPIEIAGVDASPYFTLSQFVKQWPSNTPGPRFVLMITNGIDPYNGSTSLMNQDSPYVQAAQEDAERAGVAVYSIYWGQDWPRRARGSLSGQSYLAQVGDATGAESYNIGIITPPDLMPYLKQFKQAIAHSYVIGFQLPATKVKPDTLVHIKLTTSQHGVKLHAPHNVHPGVSLD